MALGLVFNKCYHINMKFLKKNFLALFLFMMISLPVFSLAADANSELKSTTKIINPFKATDFGSFIKSILTGVIKIGIPVVAVALIYSGFLFVAAQGNSEKLGEAKKALIYSLIGAAILFGSWTIAQIITNTVLAL